MVIKLLVIIVKKAKTFNMFFISVFTKEADTLPEFHTSSENTIGLISFTVDKVKSKLEELNLQGLIDYTLEF